MIIKRIILFVLTGIVLTASYSFRKFQPQEQEYLLKAAFLYRFADYVDWGTDDEDVFRIAVLGESDIVVPLTVISKNNKIKNKKIIIKQYSNADDIGQCQIIFVSRKYKSPIEPVISKSDFKPVLVITEREDDFDKGSQMNFLISENKLKFEVNLSAVSRSGLKISSQLLQHAYAIKR